MTAVEIRPVSSKAELKAFIKLPWTIYRDHPNWVPPLLMDVKKQLDRKKNPWFNEGEAEYFLAWREGEVVGRISAQLDRRFNEFQGNEWGLFGFFECRNDPIVADALFDAAGEWLAARGRDRMVGPMSFNTNHECGVLVEGFERQPTIMQPWTPQYYPELFVGAGFGKAMDLRMWWLDLGQEGEVMDVIWQLAEKIDQEGEFTIRKFNRRDFNNEIRLFLEIYNASWEKNWGFVPLTDAEVYDYAKQLKPVLDPDWVYIIEKGDEVAAVGLILPDYNQVLKHLNGRLLPFGWLKALWYRRKINSVRAFALGVHPKFQHSGVAARLYKEYWDQTKRSGIFGGEMGWILETNTAMNNAVEAMHSRIVSNYRLYERMLPGAAATVSEDTDVATEAVSASETA